MNSKGHFSFTIGEIITVLALAIGIPALIVFILSYAATKALKYFGYFPKWESVDLMFITAPSIFIIAIIVDYILQAFGH